MSKTVKKSSQFSLRDHNKVVTFYGQAYKIKVKAYKTRPLQVSLEFIKK